MDGGKNLLGFHWGGLSTKTNKFGLFEPSRTNTV